RQNRMGSRGHEAVGAVPILRRTTGAPGGNGRGSRSGRSSDARGREPDRPRVDPNRTSRLSVSAPHPSDHPAPPGGRAQPWLDLRLWTRHVSREAGSFRTIVRSPETSNLLLARPQEAEEELQRLLARADLGRNLFGSVRKG